MPALAPIPDDFRTNHNARCVFKTEQSKFFEAIGRRKVSHLWHKEKHSNKSYETITNI